MSLTTLAQQIFENVKTAMQEAEGMGGPEGEEYLDLMNAIAAEAKKRHDVYADILATNPKA